MSQGSAGLSIADAQGRWTGLDADLCRALAAAVLGDASKTRFVPLSSQQRFPALQSGEIDVLNRNTTITSGRDAGLGIVSAGIVFYDGQGFMVPKKLGVRAPPNWTARRSACSRAPSTNRTWSITSRSASCRTGRW